MGENSPEGINDWLSLNIWWSLNILRDALKRYGKPNLCSFVSVRTTLSLLNIVGNKACR